MASKYIGALVDEYDNFFKEAVKKDAKGKALANQKELDEIKQERLDALKAKVSDLEIWEGVEIRKSSYRTKFVNGALMSSPIIMGEYLIYKLGKWVYERMAYGDKKEEEIPLSPFPIANPVVTHFHPVAFVEQMRRMSVDRAPWVEIAINEWNLYKGVRQTESPLKEQIYKYFDSSSYPSGTNKTNWCAAFVNWCFEETKEYKGTNPIANVAAYDWLPPSSAKELRDDVDGWKEGIKLDSVDEAFVGAIIVFSHSHVAFVVGQTEDKKSLIYLGGNQSDGAPNDGKGKRTICTNPKLKTGFNSSFWLIKPKNYKVVGKTHLPIISSEGAELSYEDTHS
ncbi:hypothetical protein BZG02_07285 [Labilibaculum filiforme]|uniref:Peptidase C51 domain-containing protein n=1 Tax=Labilibaculum filiforme TaxID=1940526 RepID=A0A2N3I0H2_9BACT|nr:CHAP domain-containing protein [Labilibaculum filiforme]PKQ63820.1 hypothetical protein BZG02_07285 [Labilibaculum filiforme]